MTNVLLDSHVLIWLDMDSKRLSATAVSYMTDPNNRLLLSAASVWESWSSRATLSRPTSPCSRLNPTRRPWKFRRRSPG